MNNIYIPAIGNQDFIYIQPQIYSENEDYDNILVTGLIDNEIEQSIYISTTLLIKQKIKIPNFLHIHFPDYNYYKSGISASLGIYYSLLCHLSNRILKNIFIIEDLWEKISCKIFLFTSAFTIGERRRARNSGFS